MKMLVFAVRDRAADAFARPIFVPSVGLAVRSFTDEINRAAADNQMYVHPDDFDLYELGVYDEESGLLECHKQPKMVCIGKQVKIRDNVATFEGAKRHVS